MWNSIAGFAEEIEAPPRPKSAPKALTAARTVQLLDALSGTWPEPLVGLAFTSGMCRGEVCGLRWELMPAIAGGVLLAAAAPFVLAVGLVLVGAFD